MAISILGERVHTLRRRKELTQKILAKEVGLTGNTISRLEAGSVEDLSARHVSRLADVLETSMDYLMGRIHVAN